MKTHHKTVPFDLINGKTVYVDVGVVDVLTELKRLGVKTQYSCQGDKYGKKHSWDTAYFLADRKTTQKLLKQIRRNLSMGVYSKDAKNTARAILLCRTSFTCYLYSGKGTDNSPMRTLSKLQWTARKRSRIYSAFKRKHSWSNAFGGRINVSWYPSYTEKFLQLLKET